MHVLERFAAGDVVDEQHSECFAVVRDSNSAVLFLAGSVPQLRLDGSPVFHDDVLRCELNTDCRTHCLGKLVFEVATEQTGFADRHVAEQDD